MDIFIKDMLKVLCTNLLKNALKNKKVIAKVHVILGHPSYIGNIICRLKRMNHPYS
jgi:hypothetical protein